MTFIKYPIEGNLHMYSMLLLQIILCNSNIYKNLLQKVFFSSRSTLAKPFAWTKHFEERVSVRSSFFAQTIWQKQTDVNLSTSLRPEISLRLSLPKLDSKFWRSWDMRICLTPMESRSSGITGNTSPPSWSILNSKKFSLQIFKQYIEF